MNLVPERETFTSVPVWVRLYSLPLDYWQQESFSAIGNKLGHFVKASEATRKGKYTSFARICVEMDLSRALPDEVILEVLDEEWVQIVDYEHIPFRCSKCHEYGHLFRDFPLSKIGNISKTNTMKDSKSFHKVVQKGKGRKRGPNLPQTDKHQAIQNRFQALVEEEVMRQANQVRGGNPVEEEKEDNEEQTQNRNKQKEDMMSDAELEMDQEMTQSDMEMEDHELQEILEKENLDLEGFLKQGTKEVVDSLPQEEFHRVQQLFIWETQNKGSEKLRKNEKQGNGGVKAMKVTPGLAPRITGNKRGRKKQNGLLMECGKLMIDSSSKRRQRLLSNRIKQAALNVIFIQETKCSIQKIKEIHSKWLNRFEFLEVKAENTAGGILTLWNPQKIDMIDAEASRDYLLVVIQPVGDKEMYMVTNVYDPQTMESKLLFLDSLQKLRERHAKIPWILGGDFNMIKTLSEKKGGTRILTKDFDAFQTFIDSMKLVDIVMNNGTFTWNNKRGGESQVASKLDRFIISEDLIIKDKDIVASVLPFGGSDRWLVQLDIQGISKPNNRPFKFENIWLSHPDFYNNIAIWWIEDLEIQGTRIFLLQKRLKHIKLRLKEWNKKEYGNIFEEKKKLEGKM
eukprot:PITA_13184